MDLGVYKRLIGDVKNYISFIVMCNSGEPLMHDGLPSMVEYATLNGIRTYISTNATLLSPSRSKKLIDAGLSWINFSFDGVSPEIYEKIRVNANFDKTLHNIKRFLELNKEVGGPVVTELQILLLSEEGRRDYELNGPVFKTQFSGLGLDNFQVRKPSTWGGHFIDDDSFEYQKVDMSLFSPCSYLWCTMSILWDGTVVACPSDFFGDNILGKYPDQSVMQIWNGEPMLRFRQAMINGEYLDYNRNCLGCDSLHQERILTLPAGMRGVCANAASDMLGTDFLIRAKRLAKVLNPKFVMDADSHPTPKDRWRDIT